MERKSLNIHPGNKINFIFIFKELQNYKNNSRIIIQTSSKAKHFFDFTDRNSYRKIAKQIIQDCTFVGVGKHKQEDFAMSKSLRERVMQQQHDKVIVCCQLNAAVPGKERRLLLFNLKKHISSWLRDREFTFPQISKQRR